jgi:ParB family chromosome partitioning protein
MSEQPVVKLTTQVGIVYRDPADLTPFFNNPRMNDDAVADLKKSITEYGFLVPIVVDAEGVIVTGHTRHKAATQLGLDQVPVIYASHLNEAQIKAFRIADNRLSENAKWDETKLSEELRSLQDMGFDMEMTGFSVAELDCICGQINADCLKDLDFKTVCGDVVEQVAVATTNVVVSVGNYRFHVPVEAYKLWEAELMQQHPKRRDQLVAVGARIGFDITTVADTKELQPIAKPDLSNHHGTHGLPGESANPLEDKAALLEEAHASGDVVTGGE